jgi:hypothetical protein
MQVEVSSIDGSDHEVQIYTDISAGMDQESFQNPCIVLMYHQNGYPVT